MIDYETYCEILKMHQQHLRICQIAANLTINEQTVRHWIAAGCYRQRKSSPRASKLDPWKSQIVRWLDKHPLSSKQIFQLLVQQGYCGGITIVKDYITTIRPRKPKGTLTLSFAPGECAQVDWGQYGSVAVGSTRRRLSFFVMVLCYSRMMYLEFTVMEKMEHFLNCHRNAFEYFGAVPEAVMVDNLKCAVLQRFVGQAPVFNPRYLDMANHYGYTIRACNVGKGNEKGRVENGVGYVKKNFLNGLEIPDFSAIQPAARQWQEQIANVRIHGTTRKQPIELFGADKQAMRPLPDNPYDTSVIRTVRVNNRFRIVLDTNKYSVPAEYASSQVNLKAYPDRLCIYHNSNLIAQHPRCYDRNQEFEHPDHPRQLLLQRRKAREQQIYMRFLKLSPRAELYYQSLANRRMNPRRHVRQIVALGELHGTDIVREAMDSAFELQAFSCEYIANLVQQRQRVAPQSVALHLTHRQDLLDMEIEEPDLSVYELEITKEI
ncbi:MAG: IS21 family transposase [Bacteroidia bacterium]|nr:IS21 family transposase [Bacteroidia bacterium]